MEREFWRKVVSLTADLGQYGENEDSKNIWLLVFILEEFQALRGKDLCSEGWSDHWQATLASVSLRVSDNPN